MNVLPGFAKVSAFVEYSVIDQDYGDSFFYEQKGGQSKERMGVWRQPVPNLIYSSNEKSFLLPSERGKN